MSELTNGMYAEIGKAGKGVKTFLKLSRLDAFAFIKLSQFIGRGIKEKIFSNDYSEKFTRFAKETKGEFSIFRVPFKENMTRENALPEIKNYLDKANIKYCIQEAINKDDKAVHICVDHKDEQKFNVMFEDYIKKNLTGGEMNKNDLVNFTDGKTSIVSIPDASVADMSKAMTELNVNFAQLPDLMPDDGEKQFRIASVDLNATKQAYDAYKRSIFKATGEDLKDNQISLSEMKVYTEDDYMNTAKETPEEWMKSASPEIKQKLDAFDQLDPTAQEAEIRSWSFDIKDAKSYECQALRGNMSFSELSIDSETLVESSPIVSNLNQKFPNYFFCTVPGTRREDTLMIPKNQVFRVNDADRTRYVAFVDNRKEPHIYNKHGERDLTAKYANGKDLYKKFDWQSKDKISVKGNAKASAKAVSKTEKIDIPVASPVKTI